jgi:antitoxin component of MazEF toxin-antitoxin module
MFKRLTKTGNSVALVLERPVLEATQLEAGAEVEVSTNGDVIIVSPVRDKKRNARLRAIVEELDNEYAGAFRRLAK